MKIFDLFDFNEKIQVVDNKSTFTSSIFTAPCEISLIPSEVLLVKPISFRRYGREGISEKLNVINSILLGNSLLENFLMKFSRASFALFSSVYRDANSIASSILISLGFDPSSSFSCSED